MDDEPSLARSLGDGRTTLADVVHAVRYEAATRLSDVTLRRTHLAWFTDDHARRDAPGIAEVMGRELGWTDPERDEALAAHEHELVAEGL